ncbi:MAG: hypothetical protein AB1705_15475 [Verrucomicrobiota bacterium]
MKVLKFLMFTAVAVALGLLLTREPATAQTSSTTTADLVAFSAKGDDGTTLSHVILSAEGVGVPRIQFIDCNSDKAGSALTFYSAGTPLAIASNATASTTLAVVTTSAGLASNDVVVIRKRATDTYVRAVVTTNQVTNVTFTAAQTVTAGDLIYEMSANGAIGVGATSNKLFQAYGNTGVYNGQRGRPVLIELDGTSDAYIKLVSGSYER